MQEEKNVKLAINGQANEQGNFEIMVITAGEGNGWNFGEEALKRSVKLWAKAPVFVDHKWFDRSVHDLGGLIKNTTWDNSKRGISGELVPMGPQGELVAAVGRGMLAEKEEDRPEIGFSADVVFTAKDADVQEILRINSVDLVIGPARGGAFVRVLESLAENKPIYSKFIKQGVEKMEEKENKQETERAELAKIEGENLLNLTLGASGLPSPAKEKIRAQFEGRSFTAAELDKALDDTADLVSKLTAGDVVKGPRIHGVFSSEDQVSAAVHDLLGATRPEELKALKVARLSGIRELYTMATGDVFFQGGYDEKRAQFAVTADLPGVLKNALNVLVLMQWQELGNAGYRWWEKIVDVQHFNSLHDLTGVLMGEITVLPVVAEAGSYTSLPIKDSPETGAFVKYGGYVGLTLEMIERDQTNKLTEIPKKLASSALRRISSLVSAVFTANAGVGPAMADGLNVFEAGTHANLLTVALASAALENASAAIYNQSMVVGAGGTAPKLGVDGKYLLVPRALRLTGMRLMYPTFEREASIFSENMQKGEFGDVITVPEWTDATDWALVADPRLAPAIILAERFGVMPELFIADNQLQGALFTNDELRIKVRHICHVMVADYRPLHKSNVAG